MIKQPHRQVAGVAGDGDDERAVGGVGSILM